MEHTIELTTEQVQDLKHFLGWSGYDQPEQKDKTDKNIREVYLILDEIA